MIIGIGTDIIEISRIMEAINRRPEFIKRFFTQKEVEYFAKKNNRFDVIAGNFASKEAFVKALSTGFRNFKWKDIAVLRDEKGKPYVALYNRARDMVEDNWGIHISISHSDFYAVSTVIIEAK